MAGLRPTAQRAICPIAATRFAPPLRHASLRLSRQATIAAQSFGMSTLNSGGLRSAGFTEHEAFH